MTSGIGAMCSERIRFLMRDEDAPGWRKSEGQGRPGSVRKGELK